MYQSPKQYIDALQRKAIAALILELSPLVLLLYIPVHTCTLYLNTV